MPNIVTVRQVELTRRLYDAARWYYDLNDEIMSDREYDKLESELFELEEESGIVLIGSRRDQVGWSPRAGVGAKIERYL